MVSEFLGLIYIFLLLEFVLVFVFAFKLLDLWSEGDCRSACFFFNSNCLILSIILFDYYWNFFSWLISFYLRIAEVLLATELMESYSAMFRYASPGLLSISGFSCWSYMPFSCSSVSRNVTDSCLYLILLSSKPCTTLYYIFI